MEWELGDHVIQRNSGDEYTITRIVTTETLNSTKKHRIYTVAKDENAQGKIVSMEYNDAMMKNIFTENKEYVEPVKMFPILKTADPADLRNTYPHEIPWEWLNEEWCIHEHGSELKHVAFRGGMSASEIYCNIMKCEFKDCIPHEDAIKWLSTYGRTTSSRLSSIGDE
jgi:hypothetical protein